MENKIKVWHDHLFHQHYFNDVIENFITLTHQISLRTITEIDESTKPRVICENTGITGILLAYLYESNSTNNQKNSFKLCKSTTS
jgi:hypothetical protein